MKRFIFAFFAAFAASLFPLTAGDIIILTDPPIARVEDGDAMMPTSTTAMFSRSRLKAASTTASVTTVIPVSARIDGSDLTVSFDKNLGMVNIMIYNATNQLVEMTTVDTSTEMETVLSTEMLPSGNYTLVITYGSTTLKGLFTL